MTQRVAGLNLCRYCTASNAKFVTAARWRGRSAMVVRRHCCIFAKCIGRQVCARWLAGDQSILWYYLHNEKSRINNNSMHLHDSWLQRFSSEATFTHRRRVATENTRPAATRTTAAKTAVIIVAKCNHSLLDRRVMYCPSIRCPRHTRALAMMISMICEHCDRL